MPQQKSDKPYTRQVLIVDDEAELLLSIRAGFTHYDDFQIMTAKNGREALDIIENNKIDLVVTDLRMPEMDGVELLAAMSESFPEIPSIVMTAFGTSAMEQRLQKVGTLNLIEKPLDIDTLEQEIERALDFYTDHDSGAELDIFLQLVAMEKKTVHLKVFNPEGEHGSFFFRKGFLVDAEQGDLIGEEAVLSMLEWKKIKLGMKEFTSSCSEPDAQSDAQSGLASFLPRISYRREQYGMGNPFDKVRREFNHLQKNA